MQQQQQQLRLLVFDLKLLPMVPFVGTGMYSEERVSTFVQYLVNLEEKYDIVYDVIVLQEIFSPSLRYTLTDMLRYRYKMRYVEDGPSRVFFSTRFVGGGLMIASRIPFRSAESINYPLSTSSSYESLACKGASHVLLEGSGQRPPLHLFNSHNQSGRNTVEIVGRMRQLQVLAEFVYRTTRDDEHSIVIAGDLNVDPAYELHEYAYFMGEFQEAVGSEYEIVDLLLRSTEHGDKAKPEEHRPICYGELEGLNKEILADSNYYFDESTDYVLFISRRSDTWRADAKKTRVAKFDNVRIAGAPKELTRLSDHFAIDSILHYGGEESHQESSSDGS